MLWSIYLINSPLLYLSTGLRCNAVECDTIKSTWSPADLSQHNGRHRSRKSPSDAPRHLKHEPAQSKKQPKQDRKWASQERLLSQVTLERRHGAGQRVTHCRQHCWANHNPRPGAHVLPQPAFSPPCALSAQIIPHGTGKDSKEVNETFTHTHNNVFHVQPLKSADGHFMWGEGWTHLMRDRCFCEQPRRASIFRAPQLQKSLCVFISCANKSTHSCVERDRNINTRVHVSRAVMERPMMCGRWRRL